MQAWKDYMTENKDRFLDELIDLLKIPSISADSKYKGDVAKCAEAVKQSLLDAGCDSAEICPTDGHPIVYGEKIVDPSFTNSIGIRALRCATTRPVRSLGKRSV